MEQVSHPRIARMYEAVETPKRMHLIMECLDGGNLCSYVKAKRRLSEDESRKIFFQILQVSRTSYRFRRTSYRFSRTSYRFRGGNYRAMGNDVGRWGAVSITLDWCSVSCFMSQW